MATAGIITYTKILNKKMRRWINIKKVECPDCGEAMDKNPTLNKGHKVFTCDNCRLLVRYLEDVEFRKIT